MMKYYSTALIFFLVIFISACNTDSDSEALLSSLGDSRSLFVASGGCYGGGVTVSTGSATVSAYDLTSGNLKRVIVDYNAFSPGDMPVGIVDFDPENLLITIENTSGRRIDLVRKDGSSVQTYISNSTALSAVLRSIIMLPDLSLLVSKSSAVEKFAPSKSRILQGANPYINAPAGSCATSTTLISSIGVFPNGKILYSHAAATPNNKIALISSAGYAVAGDCLAAQGGPTTVALPTGVLIHSSGKTLVSYGSTTSASNFIYSYDVNSTANTISNALSAFYDPAVVNGPSAMTEDPYTQYIYVANGLSTSNTIERFSLNPNGTLTRLSSKPFVGNSLYTRCISALKVGDDP